MYHHGSSKVSFARRTTTHKHANAHGFDVVVDVAHCEAEAHRSRQAARWWPLNPADGRVEFEHEHHVSVAKATSTTKLPDLK